MVRKPKIISPPEIEEESYENREIFKPNPGPQTSFLEASEQEVLFGGPLHLDTRVITDSGVKQLSSISVGDKVLSPSGRFVSVIDIPFEGKEESYEITFSNGHKVIASKGHRWQVGTSDWRKTKTPFREKRTFELTDFKLPKGRNKYFLPSAEPYDGPVCSDYISPYILGVLLADGCVTKSVAIFTEDSPILKRVIAELPKDYTLVYSGAVCYRVVKTKGKGKSFRQELRRLNLFGKNSFTKFIPERYFYFSKKDRLSLLEGLMDSDGTVRKFDGVRRSSECKYTTVSEQLSKDVRRLAESLGFTTTVYTEVLSSGNTAYRVIMSGKENPFYLPRKRDKKDQFPCKQNRLYITDMKFVGIQPVRCITIDSRDELFTLEGSIVTKNSAGGGKSFSLVFDPLRYVSNPEFRGLLLRRTTEELRELISISKNLYPKFDPGARWTERDKTWYFSSGASLWMSYLERDDDVLRYQGQAYSWVGFDELTQWPTSYPWNYLRSRLRTSKASGLPLCMRASTNPGNIGHQWVKKMFIDPAPANKSFWARDEETGEVLVWPSNSTHAQANDLVGKPMFKRRFIPSTLFDNPYLAEDGLYEANLLSLPEHLRKQLLEGNWDVNEGAAFPEWNRNLHVIEPFEIPRDWVRFRAADYGYGSHTAVLWFALDPNKDQLIVYREMKVSKVTAVDLADLVLEQEEGDRIQYGVLDSSLWHKRGDPGPSLAEQMIRKGCRWRPSDRSKGSRIASKNEVHRRLMVDEWTSEPGLVFFNTCINCISDIPSLPLDRKNPEDVDTNVDDHCYSDDTEVLTGEGWKLFKDVDIGGDTFASLTQDNELEWVSAVRKIEKDYKGLMKTVLKNSISLSVTPDHKMVACTQASYKKWKTNEWQFFTPEDWHRELWVPRTAKVKDSLPVELEIAGKKVDSDSFLWFLGFYLAEGCTSKIGHHYKIIVDQKNDLEVVHEQLSRLPWGYTTYKNKEGTTRFYIYNKELYGWFTSVGLQGKKSYEKFVPSFVWDLPNCSLEEMFWGLMFGDGTWSANKYDTTSKKLADDFQRLLLQTGRVGNVSTYRVSKYKSGLPHYRDIHRIHIRESGWSNILSEEWKDVSYDGRVYCVELEKNHTLYVRHNGKTMWSGNCYDALRYGLQSRPSPNRGTPSSRRYQPADSILGY